MGSSAKEGQNKREMPVSLLRTEYYHTSMYVHTIIADVESLATEEQNKRVENVGRRSPGTACQHTSTYALLLCLQI